VKKLIAALTLIVLVCCSSIVSANPYWAHDEPQEQWSDFLYSNPLILPSMVIMFALVAGGIFLLWFYRSESKTEANP
jgi:ABC-type Fe3+ transport system permease subunit